MTNEAALKRYNRSATRAASAVITTYSTSFGAATRLLGARHRHHVRNIYALVRVADELVDGVASGAGLDAGAQRTALDEFEAETHRAMASSYSSDLIIHAFAQTARAAHIDAALTKPFFASMRADLPEDAGVVIPAAQPDMREFDDEAHDAYVYGSAEVVGLMCLRVFTRDRALTPHERKRLEHGARELGAAFQNVNFLRDLADDTEVLKRSYLSANGRLTDADRDDWIRKIREELTAARDTLPLLPKDARRAVRCALNLFAALTHKISRTPVAELYRRRVRVSNPHKGLLVIRSLVRTWMEPA